MKSLGILLVVGGVFVVYAVVHGKVGSPQPSPSSSASASSGGGGGTPFNPASSAAWKIGPGGLGGDFAAIDTTGTVTGAVGGHYSISGKSYADLTPQQRDDANAFAQHPTNAA